MTKPLSKRRMESLRRAERVAQEVRYQMAAGWNEDPQRVLKLVIKWMRVTSKKVKYARP